MKQKFSDAEIAAFLQKSYFAVDGLWFVKTEEKRGFDEAMDLDEAVWEVMPKIQARKARALLGIDGNSLEDLVKAFQLKLSAEGYDFDIEQKDGEFLLKLRMCPWYEVVKSSNRHHVMESVTHRICTMEFAGWTKEFANSAEFEFMDRLCMDPENCCECKMVFRGR